MKTRMNFWLLALMICTFVSCADNANFEPEEQAQEREQLREKLSHEVTQAEARVKLEKMLPNLKLPSTRGGDTNSLPPITSVYTTGKAAVATRAGEEVEPYFHIFNFGDNEGFAIMSGDDRVEPLLALTFKGELSPETEIDNSNFEFAYEKMEEYYVAKIANTSYEDLDVADVTNNILPLPGFGQSAYYYEMPLGHCLVQWHQMSPYNKYCTLQPGNTPAFVGCVAVAVAQLMSIYKYPSSYHSYTYNTTYDFNWNDMVLATPSLEGENQIARLMQQLGISVNLCVHYNAVGSGSGSGADSNNIPRTLENFGYANGGELVGYNTIDVVQELIAGYPVLIGGNDGSLGHRWLGHGLMALTTTTNNQGDEDHIPLSPAVTYYILCNWGWGGNSDGYFLSGVFDTSNPYVDNTTRSYYYNNVNVVKNIRR